MQKLFGTDGIRGEVGKYPLTPEAVFAIGRTLGVWLKEKYPQEKGILKIVAGKDTRESGEKLELALLKGASQEGLEVLRAGVCPTPAVAYLTCALGAQMGAAISASHNPGSDNGIKFFDADGYKLFSSAEKRIEEIFSALPQQKTAVNLKMERKEEKEDFIRLYLDFVKSSMDKRLSGFKVVVDCAFGSFSEIAPRVLRELGAQVYAINNQPDGTNINVNCGTLYPQAMSKLLLQYKADMGIALDGDGDRVVVCDEKGNVLDGDHILAILSEHFIGQKRLQNHTVVSTQMSNIGLELFLKGRGVRMIRTPVGDKYVLEQMLKLKANLGGEQSGHIIILERTTTGDGLIVALELIKVMVEQKRRLSVLGKRLEKFPQTLANVRVKEKRPFEEISGLNQKIDHYQKELGENGRLLVRYSGTEDLARIMVEARQHSEVVRIASSLARVFEDSLGVDKKIASR